MQGLNRYALMTPLQQLTAAMVKPFIPDPLLEICYHLGAYSKSRCCSDRFAIEFISWGVSQQFRIVYVGTLVILWHLSKIISLVRNAFTSFSVLLDCNCQRSLKLFPNHIESVVIYWVSFQFHLTSSSKMNIGFKLSDWSEDLTMALCTRYNWSVVNSPWSCSCFCTLFRIILNLHASLGCLSI